MRIDEVIKSKKKVKQSVVKPEQTDEDLMDTIKSTFGDIAKKGGEYVAGQILSKISTGGV